MSITIDNPEAEQLVAELSTRMATRPDDLLLDLLRRERARLERDVEPEVRRAFAESQAVVDRWKARPLVDQRSVEDVIAYDDDGLPV
jgi:hypothetical protein